MTMEADALKWARMPLILTEDELKDRLTKRQFMDLYVDICGRLAEQAGDDPNAPSPLVYVHARSIAADTWKLYRESSDATIVHEHMTAASYHAGRASHVRDTETRVRVKGTLMRSVQQTVDGLKTLARSTRVYTLPVGKARRAKKG